MYFIDPQECIDCGVCVAECPVDAIYPEDEIPAAWGHFVDINDDFFGHNGGLSGVPVRWTGPPPYMSGGAEVEPLPDDVYEDGDGM